MASRLIDELAVGLGFNYNDTGIDQAQRRMRDFESALSRLARAGAVLVAGAIWEGSPFETSLINLRTQLGLTQAEMENARDFVDDLELRVAVDGTELANAMFALRSAGLDAANSNEVLAASGEAAAIKLGNTRDIALLAGGAINAYGADVIQGRRAVEILHATVKEGNLEAAALAGAMAPLLSFGSQLKIQFDELGAAVAGYTRTGTSANQAATAVRGAMAALIKPTTQARKELAKVGLTSDQVKQSVREKGLLATLADLNKVFEGNEERIAKVFSRVESLGFVLHASGQNAEQYAGILDNVTNSSGSLAEAMEIVTDTGFFNLQLALTTAKDLLQQVYEILIPVIKLFSSFPDYIQKAFIALAALQVLAQFGFAPSIGLLVTNMKALIATLWGFIFGTGASEAAVKKKMFTQIAEIKVMKQKSAFLAASIKQLEVETVAGWRNARTKEYGIVVTLRETAARLRSQAALLASSTTLGAETQATLLNARAKLLETTARQASTAATKAEALATVQETLATDVSTKTLWRNRFARIGSFFAKIKNTVATWIETATINVNTASENANTTARNVNSQSVVRSIGGKIKNIAVTVAETTVKIVSTTWTIIQAMTNAILHASIWKLIWAVIKLLFSYILLAVRLAVAAAGTIATAVAMLFLKAVTLGLAAVNFLLSTAFVGVVIGLIATTIATIKATIAFLAANVALAGIPLIIGLIVVGLFMLVKHWNKVWEKLKQFFGWLKRNASTILSVMFPWLAIPIQLVKNWGKIKGALSPIFNWLQDRFSGIFNFFRSIIAGFVDFVVSHFKGMADMIVWLWDHSIGWLINQIWKVVRGIGMIFGLANDEMDELSRRRPPGGGSHPPSGVVNQITSALSNPITTPPAGINSYLAPIPVAAPTPTPSLDNRSVNINELIVNTQATNSQEMALGASEALGEHLQDTVFHFDSNVRQ